MEGQITKAYTIKEVSKIINVPPGTLRQWEKDLKGLLIIPRTNQGARFYTDHEIGLLAHIKQMRDKNLSKDLIREMMEKHLNQAPEEEEADSTSLSVVPEQPKEQKKETPSVQNMEPFFEAMEVYKEKMILEMKEGLQHIVRNEVLPEVKKEISNGSLQTVKSLSNSIYKSSEKTSTEIKELSDQLTERSKRTSEVVGTLHKRLSKASKGTSEEINNVLKEIAKTKDLTSAEIKMLLEEIASSKEDTKNELVVFSEMLNKEREYLMEAIQEDRIELNKEIRKREETFQDLVIGFRETAAAKKKNWWKFWG